MPALIRHIEGEITLEEAAEIGRADTRHYAKRQFTWFRHQLPEFEWVKPEAARDGWTRSFRAGPRDLVRESRALRFTPRNDCRVNANSNFALAECPEPR